jgi:hypothetical protein
MASISEDPEYDNLRDTHKIFITNVLAGKTYTDAYALAYPNASLQTARSKSSAMYKRFKDLIERHTPLSPDVIHVIAEQTIQNLKAMAFADVSEMINKNTGKPLPLHRMPKPLRMGITEISVKGDKYTYVIGGKLKAMELLAKITKLDEAPKTEVNITISEEEKENRIKEILVSALGRNTVDTEDNSESEE